MKDSIIIVAGICDIAIFFLVAFDFYYKHKKGFGSISKIIDYKDVSMLIYFIGAIVYYFDGDISLLILLIAAILFTLFFMLSSKPIERKEIGFYILIISGGVIHFFGYFFSRLLSLVSGLVHTI